MNDDAYKVRFSDGGDERFCGALPVYEEQCVKESSEDFILPDYLPDVKKIAAVFPTAVIKGRFPGSGTLEFDGEAHYRILYIAEDQSLKSALFITGFEDKIGCGEVSSDCVDLLTPLCENVSVRLLNPRKINIKSANGARVQIFRRHSSLPQLVGASLEESERTVQCRTEEIDSVNVLNLRENGLTLSEDLNFEAAMPSATELIFGRVQPVVQDCRVSEGEAQIRGAAEIDCAVSVGKTDAGREEWMPMHFSLSFSQTVKNEGLHEGGECFCLLSPEGSEFRLREDEFGQKRVIEFDMTYLCDLRVFYPKKVSVITDAYSTEKETECALSDKTFVSFLAPLKGSFSVNESVALDLPEDGGYTLAQFFLAPELHLAEESGKEDGALLEGSCAAYLILRDGAGAPDVRRTGIPLRFRTGKKAEEGSAAQISCKVSGARLRVDKNILTCDFEVGFFGQLLGKNRVTTMDELRVLPEKRQAVGRRGSVILYFPGENEPVFEIAKRYGVPAGELDAQSGAPGALFIACR